VENFNQSELRQMKQRFEENAPKEHENAEDENAGHNAEVV